LGEVREAVDFCRYYAMLARREFAVPKELPGPTGESNRLELAGRGPFACISPWNFPLSIFTGQAAAAFAAGNAVLAKPAEQTPLVGAAAVRALLDAGVPPDAIAFLPGRGETVGAALVADPGIAGVCFTGSTATARAIQRSLAAREGPLVPLIAETGGLNAMLVDSSALAEQVVADVLASAFDSAGQRCSSLRILCLQEEVAARVIEVLAGAVVELRLGDPARLSTDVGPVIDADALAMLQSHAERMDREAKLLCKAPLPEGASERLFFAPRAYELASLAAIEREVFGPILHVVHFASRDLEAMVDAVNAKGYGLTMGIHSRIEETVERVRRRARVGNLYVNRNMIGATVGVQPFGGEGLSGTGPKAGGPHYLYRFAVERTFTVNTAAAGGNAALLSGAE
jgi:RHH-type proline utilization regulon transcriptional repressor/proline dehydrogenase/delta 1-pyrroline-5-carboxylate dehydrogenase